MTISSSIIVAFGSIPKDGGTFTFYRNLCPALLKYGIDLRCISIGKHDANLWDTAFVDDGCVLLAKDETSVKAQAIAFSEWCVAHHVDVVIGINSQAILSALPHLPGHIRVVSRCANGFDHGYKITLSCYERLARIIALTPRLQSDLTNHYGADANKITLIPNGIAPDRFQGISESLRGQEKTLRLGFLGRLEHNQKGVLFLPEIIQHLEKKEIDFKLRIAGKGIHKKALERKLASSIKKGRVIFEGALSPNSVLDFLGETDIFLFPSQFEGCPNVLLEGMMAGCVPVTFLIEGTTDFIVKNGITGFVCPMGDCEAFATNIAELSSNRDRLRQMSVAASADARKRFSQEKAAKDYAGVFKEVMNSPPLSWTPLPWSAFQPDPAFVQRNNWKSLLPEPVKRIVKNGLFYTGLSDHYYE
nr:glycosyltransferase family 4 protein [Candidatus Electrothrix aestuarii]